MGIVRVKRVEIASEVDRRQVRSTQNGRGPAKVFMKKHVNKDRRTPTLADQVQAALGIKPKKPEKEIKVFTVTKKQEKPEIRRPHSKKSRRERDESEKYVDRYVKYEQKTRSSTTKERKTERVRDGAGERENLLPESQQPYDKRPKRQKIRKQWRDFKNKRDKLAERHKNSKIAKYVVRAEKHKKMVAARVPMK